MEIFPLSAFNSHSRMSPHSRLNWFIMAAGTVVRREFVIVEALVIVVLNPITIKQIIMKDYLIVATYLNTYISTAHST